MTHGCYLFSCFSGWNLRNKSYYCSMYFFTGNRQWQIYSSSTHEIRGSVFIVNQEQMLEWFKTFTEIFSYVCLWKQRQFIETHISDCIKKQVFKSKIFNSFKLKVPAIQILNLLFHTIENNYSEIHGSKHLFQHMLIYERFFKPNFLYMN